MKDRLREIRKNIGMTQEQMADFLGVPYRTYQNWELGTNEPPEWAFNMILEKISSEYSLKGID